MTIPRPMHPSDRKRLHARLVANAGKSTRPADHGLGWLCAVLAGLILAAILITETMT